MLSDPAKEAIAKMKAAYESNCDYALNEPLEKQREDWENSAANDVLPEEIKSKKLHIGGVTGEFYWHESVAPSPFERIILHFHGGGLTQGSSVTHRKLGSLIAAATKIPVFIHNYSLAPESPFPTALNESIEVYQALLSVGYLSQNIIFGGDSSGAALMCSTIISLKEYHLASPKAVYMMSPQLDNTFSGETIVTNSDHDLRVFLADLEQCAQHYCGSEAVNNPLISPIFADLSDFPPSFIQVGSAEILLDDARQFAQNLAACGVDVTINVWEEMWHVFQSSGDTVPEAKTALKELNDFLCSKLD